MAEQTNNIRILLVDDETDILDFISYNLQKEGFEVYTAIDGKMAIEQALRIKPHLILLDVMMPGMGGMEVCQQLRLLPDFKDVIISFLSARSEDYSQIAGFDAGADDYISKPIQPKMLVSKVKSLLRRLQPTSENSEEIQRKDIVINKESYTVRSHGETIVLPRKEFELLYLLASKPNKVFRRNEIYDAIWGNEVIVGDRTIDVHIRRLRERTGIDNIKTVKGVGYKYEE
jgi:two-component system alkaline phosphatase synthesis response regulator PhoP